MYKTYNVAGLSKWCLALSGVFVIAELIHAALTMKLYSLYVIVSKVADGSMSWPSDDFLDSYESMAIIFTIVPSAVVGIFILTVILNGLWIYRASSNSHALVPADPQHLTPGWAVGFFFIPIFSLWKPFQGMRELWNATMRTDGNRDAGAPLVLYVWWVCFVVGYIVNRFAQRQVRGDETGSFESYDALKNALLTSFAGTLLLIISAVLLMHVIRTVSKQQQTQLATQNQQEGTLE